ncbi:MAG: group II intron reverse transcriptase/maturase [Anaerolineae bacterium]|nr:group II intron reverse transcriptase/maturase [Anaerolineae bacterium]
MSKAKPYCVSKQVVWDAYKRVKANRGAAGVDKQSLEAFEEDLKGNLYKIWNRMSSGSYFPPPVRLVEIPKGKGKRTLGIPTVSDRVAQTVAKMYLEPFVEPKFHEDSYGSRPGKSALDAVATARKRCWRKNWVVDLDIKGFFDNLDWNLVMRAVRFHTDVKWLHLYIERWLRAPVEMEDGSRVERTKGSPQGSVVSPLLANLFMHHAFDDWMDRNHPNIQFERYVDDVVIHCVSEKQAKFILQAVRRRLKECRLELHPEKTQIVYCQDDDRRGRYERIKFDFLGYTFQPRRAKNRHGKYFVSFLPAISNKAAKHIRGIIRNWRMAGTKNNQSLEDLARLSDPYVRGWMNYYGRFYRSKCGLVLRYLNDALVKWARRKYKTRFRRKERKAAHWLGRIAARDPNLFVLWKLGIKPAAGR